MMTILETLRKDGFKPPSDAFYRQIEVWRSWYTGRVRNFHSYRVRTGKENTLCKRYSLGMAKKIPEDWADLLVNERLQIGLSDPKAQAFVDEVFEENNFRVRCNELQEVKFALGTVAYVASVTGQRADGSADGITIDYVTAPHIWPLSWRNGRITECAFDTMIAADGREYLYLQVHRKDGDGLYVIENRVFLYRDGQITDAQLADVPGFENIPPAVRTGSAKPQFVIDRPNIANNFDIDNPMGISVFANAIDALEGADIAYDAFVIDFLTGRRRLFISPAAATYMDTGEPVFDPSDIAYYVLPEDMKGENKPVQETGGDFAVDNTTAGVQTALNVLSAKCGFGENHYRFDGAGAATATQVIAENSTMFRTLKKHEIILRAALTELCRIILRLGNAAMRAGLDEDAEISIDFDDSIIEDKGSDFARDMQLLAAGILNDWEMRAKWLNEDEQTARAALPGMAALTTEAQDEVE